MAGENKKKIIVVEDDPFLGKAFSLKLNNAGFDVVLVKDGQEALGVITKEAPDIVLLDVMLPHKSGFDILIDLKKDEKLSKIPVIMLSTLGQEDEMKKGLSLGANEYLVKSNIKLEQVVEKINKYLK